MKKAAVLFPGIGYHTDKPLLYYSKKIAAEHGYEIIEVPYGKFPKGVKGSREKMEKAFFSAAFMASGPLPLFRSSCRYRFIRMME